MEALLIGRGHCPYCRSSIVVLRAGDDDPVPCDTRRYLIIRDGIAPQPEDRGRMVGYDLETGALVYGRRATKEERKQYSEMKRRRQINLLRFGCPFSIVVRGHLGRCPQWTGRPFMMPKQAAERCQELSEPDTDEQIRLGL